MNVGADAAPLRERALLLVYPLKKSFYLHGLRVVKLICSSHVCKCGSVWARWHRDSVFVPPAGFWIFHAQRMREGGKKKFSVCCGFVEFKKNSNHSRLISKQVLGKTFPKKLHHLVLSSSALSFHSILWHVFPSCQEQI